MGVNIKKKCLNFYENDPKTGSTTMVIKTNEPCKGHEHRFGRDTTTIMRRQDREGRAVRGKRPVPAGLLGFWRVIRNTPRPLTAITSQRRRVIGSRRPVKRTIKMHRPPKPRSTTGLRQMSESEEGPDYRRGENRTRVRYFHLTFNRVSMASRAQRAWWWRGARRRPGRTAYAEKHAYALQLLLGLAPVRLVQRGVQQGGELFDVHRDDGFANVAAAIYRVRLTGYVDAMRTRSKLNR